MQELSVSHSEQPYIAAMPGGRPPKSQKRTAFGQRLLEARLSKGLSQNHVAEALGVTQPSYADWERSAVALKPEYLPKLAALLSVSIDLLLGISSRPRSSGGPIGKARLIFEQVSQLPRLQQQRILATVEDMLLAHSTKNRG